MMTRSGSPTYIPPGPVSPGIPVYLPPNSYDSQTNISGNSEVSPGSSNHLEIITFSGSAGARVAYIDTTGRLVNDQVTIRAIFPATSGIALTVKSGNASGSAVYSYTTDGSGNSAIFKLYFDGTVWQPLSAQIPA
jgi:hypothetical protein